MPVFYFQKGTENTASLTREDSEHIVRVLRKTEGESITLSDGCGTFYNGTIINASPKGVVAELSDPLDVVTEPLLKVTVYQAVGKGQKLDTVVRRCTENGVSRIVPIITERTVSIPKDDMKKVERLEAVAREAASQSHRAVIPEISVPMRLTAAVASAGGLRLIATILPGKTEALKSVLTANPGITEASVFIGPEGGFTEAEAEMVTALGGHAITLGPRILRTETAAQTVLAVLMYHYDEMV